MHVKGEPGCHSAGLLRVSEVSRAGAVAVLGRLHPLAERGVRVLSVIKLEVLSVQDGDPCAACHHWHCDDVLGSWHMGDRP